MIKVFIDGSAGTTGLRIYERLGNRSDLQLVILPDDVRKDPAARKEALNSADVAFLCLPDAAAKEAVAMRENDRTVIIDTSTAHRTADNWTYGFPELAGMRAKIAGSKLIANPGCHAGGFIALAAPLVQGGIISPSEQLSCFSLTGYSGGGKKMIADYEDNSKKAELCPPRVYGLSQCHKHLPEMMKISGLYNPPVFSPIVSDYYSGMEVVIPLSGTEIKGSIEDIKSVYKEYYVSGLVKYKENADEDGFMSAGAFSGRDDMEISVFGNSDRITLVSRFDNLGKGASGAAIQNMNIVLGLPENTGLNVGE